jgi:hypothetical protein
MIIVTRHEIYDEQKRAVALLLGKTGEAKHSEIKNFIEAVVQAELDGAVADYREAFPILGDVENTGADIGTVRTNGDIQTRPFYSLRQIHTGKNAGMVEVEIKAGKGFKKIKVKPSAVTLKGGDE